MPSRKFIAVLLGCLAMGTVAIACNPEFPWQLLDNRAQTLKTAPANSFLFEMQHLVPAPADLHPCENVLRHETGKYGNALEDIEVENYDSPAARYPLIRAAIEKKYLTGEQVNEVEAIRNAGSPEIAEKLSPDLSPDIRFYTLGAVLYQEKDYQKAAADFTQAIAKEGIAPTVHSVWARFMLAHTYDQLGYDDNARSYFQQTREVVAKGAPDPWCVAPESFGDEARVLLDTAGVLKHEKSFDPNPANRSKLLIEATQLYGQQAAIKSPAAVDSLRMVAEYLLGFSSDLEATLDDPLIQRLTVAYVLARRYEADDGILDYVDHSAGAGNLPNWGNGVRTYSINSDLAGLLTAIEAKGFTQFAGADRLASAAYEAGHYDMAEKFAAQGNSPLASWVKAKLALQKGDLAGAAAFYAEAVKAFPADSASLDDGSKTRLQGEQGTLALARGEYVETLRQLYPQAATYQGDVDYIAERVLTPDELKGFIDQSVPAPDDAAKCGENYWEMSLAGAACQLRNILAQKLVRAGRINESIPYFDPTLREYVEAYAQAMAGLTQGSSLDRAKAYSAAASLERDHGMELIGYAGPPDEASIGGSFEFGPGQPKLEGEFITPNEKQRFNSTQAQPNVRYHYREIAADHAAKAADLLPPRSQAFAASLCQATEWTTDESRKDGFYRRYIKEGAIVPWADHFGHDCPDPDFAEARHFQLHRDLHWLNKKIRLHWRLEAGITICLVGALVIAGARFNTRKR
jgi:hypothetical protein